MTRRPDARSFLALAVMLAAITAYALYLRGLGDPHLAVTP